MFAGGAFLSTKGVRDYLYMYVSESPPGTFTIVPLAGGKPFVSINI